MLVPSFWKHPLSEDCEHFRTPLSRAFPALETPLNQEKCSMYPPKFGIISQESKEMREKKKKHPLFIKISGWKVKYTPFFTILGPDFVARKVPLYRTFWQHACGHFETWVGGGGGGGCKGRSFVARLVEIGRGKPLQNTPPNRCVLK